MPFAARASAEPAATIVVATGNGMTAPGGVAITPDDGAVWVSDALLGLCQVTSSGPVASDYCAPEPAPPPEGAPVPPPTRPTGTGQIAFDAVTDNFYVAEGTSGGSGVWRMHWNPLTRSIDAATKIFDDSGVDRVVGLALTPGGDVVFSSKRITAIRQLSRPALITAALTSAPTIGFSVNGPGAASLAVLGDVVYLADEGLLTKIDPAAPSPTAVPVAGQPNGTLSALAADPARGVVFAGTSNGDLADSVLSVVGDAFSAAAYDRGYSNITGMGVGADSALYIAHDPNGALSPGVDTLGFAELLRRDRAPLDAPDVVFTAKPRSAQQSGLVTFAFTSPNGTADTGFLCTLDDAPVDCPLTGPAQGRYEQPADAPLAEGLHRFSVRATNEPVPVAADWGAAADWTFRIDRTPPVVTIDQPSSHTAVGGDLRLFFSADSSAVTFTCQVDDRAPATCSAPKDFTLAPGAHTITVRGTDAAGNVGAPVSWDVTALPAPPAPPAPETPAPAVTGDGAGTSATGGGSSARATPAAPAIAVRPSARVPAIAIDVPCVADSPSREAARLRLSGRTALVRFRAPAQARYAKFTLRRASAKRSRARVVETLAYAKVAKAGAAHTTRITLTRGQRRKVRSGHLRLAVAYGTCRTQLGQWQWIANDKRKAARR